MKSKKQRETKMKLEDIPKVYSKERKKLLSITTLPEYTKALESGIPGFTESELKNIEAKYKNGILMVEIQNELMNKGRHIKPNTIKHYIQVGQLPRPREAREKTEKGAVSLYSADFIRHLNLVRFAMDAGRDAFKEIDNILKCVYSDLDFLEMNTDDECYEDYTYGFFNAFYKAVDFNIDQGLYFGEKAVKKAFADKKQKKDKYMKYLKKIEKLSNELSDEVSKFKREAENNKIPVETGRALYELYKKLDLIKE